MASRKVAKRWIRTAADERAVREGCYFDERHPEDVRDFIESLICLTQGEWGGRPFKFMDYQVEDILYPLYGWRRPDGRRRFKSAYISLPKKNGKSPLGAALGLYHTGGEGEPAAEVYLLACDREQAGIIYRESARMVGASPALKSEFWVRDYYKRIIHPGTNSFLTAGSSEVANKDGVSASVVIFDELHRQKDDKLYKVMLYAGRARREPLRLELTTAGDGDDVERGSICYRQYEYSKSILDGTIDTDITHLPVIYEAGEKDPVDDPATWRKANPAMGTILREEDFASDYVKAARNPSDLDEFKRLRLNMWVSRAERFIPRDRWDAGALSVEEIIRHLLRLPVLGGLDMASTTDLAGFGLVGVEARDGQDPLYYAMARGWTPRETADLREQNERTKYKTWAAEGWLTLSPGQTVSNAIARKEIVAAVAPLDLRLLLCDPHNAVDLMRELAEEDGLPAKTIRQGFISLNAPTKELQRAILEGRFFHDGSPVLRWNAANARVSEDAAGNIKIDKKRSVDKIDLLAAIINAVAGALNSDIKPRKPSVYKRRGARVFSTGGPNGVTDQADS